MPTFRRLSCFAALALLPLIGYAQHAMTPAEVTGEGITGIVQRYASFPSQHVAPRNVDVWLPPGYDAGNTYPVVYMHDGQNLFNPKESYTGVDWSVDEVMTALIDSNKVTPAIIVGVWNTPKRVPEYMPQKAALTDSLLHLMATQWGGKPISDDYLRFLVEELKPFIDQQYATKPERAHTFVMGSSMGGLISAYALLEYPEVFGGAGCVSTHWPIGDGAVIDYVEANLPPPGVHKLYFDHGTETLDAGYAPFQARVDEVMRASGYTASENWMTRVFEGADHSERAWRKRVHLPLTFFLGR